MVVGDMAVEGDDALFDNRTYTMKSDGDDDIIIGDESSGSTTSGSQTSSRYMQVDGDYGKTGNYTVTATVEVQAVGEIPSYSIIEGANGVWIQNSDGTLVFRANGDFSKFTGVKVDGTLIDVKNYTAVSGSTAITLKADYLQTLSVGKHTMTIVYNDGECNTEFEIKAATKVEITNNETLNEENPKTYDGITTWIILGLISMSGIVGTSIYRKKLSG